MGTNNGSDHGSRVVRFPSEHSLGILQARDWGVTGGWQWIGEAQGDVRVPEGKEVRLTVAPEASANLSPLSNLELDDIQWLDLTRTPVTDADLAHIENLTLLRRLNLSFTSITDVGLAHLRPLILIKDLKLNNTQIGDVGLSNLTSLSKLRNLWITETQVTDAGLKWLKELTALEVLQLPGKISAAALSELKQALPDCYINIQK